MIKIENLSKRYEDGILALDHLSLEIQPGQILLSWAQMVQVNLLLLTSSAVLYLLQPVMS